MKKLLVAMVYSVSLYWVCNAFALWKGPVEVITGAWGTSVGQFGFMNANPTDIFPKKFLIDKDSNILVSDSLNKRVQVFRTDGSITAFSYKDLDPGWKIKQWPSDKIGVYNNIFVEGRYVERQFYDYQGNLLREFSIPDCILKRVNDDGSLILQNYKTKVYYKYSPTGQLLETYKEKPLELGVVKGRSLGGKRYRTTIKYPDMTYTINKIAHKKYVRVCNELYGIYFRTVQRFNDQGEMIDELVFPEKKKRIKQAAFGGYGPFYEVVEEYGEPVVAPNGDVCTWKRTPDTYSILKWIWIDGPDSPVNLKASASDGRISLSWKKPVEDSATVTAYEIYRSSDVCGPFNKIKKVKKDVLQYADKRVKEGETYYYQVCAERGSGYSGYSNKAVGSIKD